MTDMTDTDDTPTLDDATLVIARILADHGSVNSTAAWEGSPDPSNWRNVRRVCKCGEVIGWHDRSIEKPGHWFPLSGYPFDEPHRVHVAAVLAEAAEAALAAERARVGRVRALAEEALDLALDHGAGECDDSDCLTDIGRIRVALDTPEDATRTARTEES